MADENPVEAEQFLGEDGALQEGWQGLAFPDDTDPHKTNPTLANIKNLRGLAKQVVSGESTIGKLSGGREFAIIPNEQSTPEEISEYHTKTGRPDAKEGYLLGEVAAPEGLAKDEKYIAHMSQVFFEAGTSKAMADKIVKGHMDYFQTSLAAVATQDKLDMQEANKELRAKLGAAYDKTMRDIGAIVNAFGGPIDAAETAELIKELPYDSFATQLFAKIAETFGEKGLTEVPAAATGELTPADAMAEANKIMADPYYVTDTPKDKPRNVPYHLELVEKVKKLFEAKTATSKATV